MSLCPGYHQVSQFGPDDDYEEEEEILYITLELGNVEPSLILSCDSYHLVGLDTPTPFLQLAGTVLKGRHEVLLGTELIFSKQENAVSYMESTRQRICFKEVRLEEKGKVVAKAKVDACQFVLDRVTGILVPVPRRRRTRKTEVVSEDY
ncbi:hypothetical protein EDD18DRAFT_1359068 [Armillaria luteobubalina]|uniref:Transcription factor TFIIIC triple barrel domain-containing protein n=1 Tax=Armillaria luteobubalina TaxID=153913 RepID=A0AA39UMZ8_9AGAR|nr:hypothetical protein EDD18DRAFT_1359068 [Armillaria luteobubalina]